MRFSIFLLATSLLIISVKSFSQIDNDEKWDQSYTFKKNPIDLNSAWKFENWEGANAHLPLGWLRIYSPRHQSAGAVYRISSSSGMWDGSKPTSVEFRASVIAPGRNTYGASVVVADGANFYQLNLKSKVMTTYRIDIKNNVATLFDRDQNTLIKTVEGVELPSTAKEKNFLYFGDPGSGVEGVSVWEFIRWKNGELVDQNDRRHIKFGYSRKLNHTWFPDDARQWQNFEKSILITDMTGVEPLDNLAFDKRKKGKWRVLPYETENFSGNALSVYSKTDAQSIRYPIKHEGKYAVYIGLCTSPSFHNVDRSGIRVKLSGQSSYKNIFNDIGWFDYKRDAIQEIFFSVSDIKKNDYIEFNQMPFMSGVIAYIRLIPILDEEYTLFKRDNENEEFKNNIATIDGHAIFIYNKTKTAEDLEAHLNHLDNSDFGKWWYQILGADLVNYPSKLGTFASIGTEDFPRWYDEEFFSSAKNVMDNGINSLRAVRDIARKKQVEFSVMVRAQGWYCALPFEETFKSKFYEDHPLWRCIDEYGTPTLYMSYAVPEVRQRLLDMIKETIDMCEPDGVGILFNRGGPFMLWEPAFADAFKRKYGAELDYPFNAKDKRVLALRAEIMNLLVEDLHKMLADIAQKKGRKPYKLSLSLLNRWQNEEYGLDVAEWVSKGWVDEISVAPADTEHYIGIAANSKTSIYPLITPWENYTRPYDFHDRITSYYAKGAKGITIWDADISLYNKAIEPHLSNIIRYIGHKELIDYWGSTISPKPNTTVLKKLYDLEYSGWLPNSGF